MALYPSEQLTALLHDLKLPAFAADLTDSCKQAPEHAPLYCALLDRLCRNQLALRQQSRIARCITAARFTRIQTIDEFDFSYNPATRKIKTNVLQYIHEEAHREGTCAIFVGNCGLGKTHLTRAIGYAACQRGHAVLFTSCAELLNRLMAADATRDLPREVTRLLRPTLLIIDELAYVSMTQQEANLFFQLLSRRHDANRAIAVTTNKPFSEWNQVFCGDAIAHAIVDRLTENAEIFYLEGKSYRQTHRKGVKKQS